jgi:tetratricopeptide (TPR) repeat protein
MPEDKFEVSQRISNFLTQGLNSQARAEMENLLREWPGDAEVFTLAGDVYAWTGAPSTAYRHYNSAADIYNRQGMQDKMLSVHHKILELDETLLDANTQVRIRLLRLLVAAEDALLGNRYEAAVTSYQEAIRQFPNHTVTYQRLGALLTRMGRLSEASHQYLTVARAFHQHGVSAKAAPYFERVLELDPAHMESLEALLAHMEKEGKAEESERPLKAAVQRFLERGEIDHATKFFQRLPERVQQDVTPLRAALLLQMGDIQQAEDAAKMLELGKEEISEWFRRMGRASLDRGDSVVAEMYFKWASPAAQPEVQAAPLAEPAPLPPPPPVQVPVQAAVPTPQPPLQPLPQTVPSPVPQAVPAPPPQVAFVAAAQAPESPPASPMSPAAVEMKGEDDRVVLQTMGEMCLAEEMYEEARQVFERLLRSEPARKQYLELLNKSRAGLGLGPVSGPPPPPGATPAPPPPLQAGSAATALGAPAFKPPVLAPRPAMSAPAPQPKPLADPAPTFQPIAAPAPSAMPQPSAPVSVAAQPSPLAAPTPLAVPPVSQPAAPPVPMAATPPPMPQPAAPATPPPPAPSLAPPLPKPQPQAAPTPFEAAAPPVAETPPQASLPPVAEPKPQQLPFQAPSRPVLEPVAVRSSHMADPVHAQPGAPTVEWADPQGPPAFAPSQLAGIVSGPATVQRDIKAASKPVPALAGASPEGARIIQTAHTFQLGELPPSTPSNLDFDDDIIE